jgi:hypothetical protein
VVGTTRAGTDATTSNGARSQPPRGVPRLKRSDYRQLRPRPERGCSARRSIGGSGGSDAKAGESPRANRARLPGALVQSPIGDGIGIDGSRKRRDRC